MQYTFPAWGKTIDELTADASRRARAFYGSQTFTITSFDVSPTITIGGEVLLYTAEVVAAPVVVS